MRIMTRLQFVKHCSLISPHPRPVSESRDPNALKPTMIICHLRHFHIQTIWKRIWVQHGAIDTLSICWGCSVRHYWFNTLRPRRNQQHFADDIFKRIFFNKNVWILIKISLNFVRKGPINNIPALVQIMAWRRSGDKPLSEPMMVSLPTHICVTRPQWVKLKGGQSGWNQSSESITEV